MQFFNRIGSAFSVLEIVSLGLNVILLLIFLILYKIGKFSNDFVEAKTIENTKMHYRIETYKTKFNERLYKVIDKDKDKVIKKSKKFTSKLNLDRDILRTYENADQVIGVGVAESNELHEEIVAP